MPSINVISSILNRLWGFGEVIHVLLLSSRFLLVELPSIDTCDWILVRSWHIHHHPMLIRKWHQGIQLLDLFPKAKSTWITFCKVPPTLLTEEGISSMASQYGKPIHKPVREGLSAKVCVLHEDSSNMQGELKVHLWARRSSAYCCGVPVG
ncbi:hypothetical protein LINPERHAP1_LOCUS22417 [Linum perenne]